MKKHQLGINELNKAKSELKSCIQTPEDGKVFDSISSHIYGLIQDGVLGFDSPREIQNEVCNLIDEKLEENFEKNSEEFLEKLEELRIREYLKMGVLGLGTNLKSPMLADHFLHNRISRLTLASKLLGKEFNFSNEFSTEYFLNPENTKYDLQQFANGIDSGKIEDLSTVNPKPSTKVTLRNNQEISWEAYLRNASLCLFGTKSRDKDNPHRTGDALRELKRVVGIELETITEKLSKKYLENPENTKYDLQQFANGINSGKIEDLSTGNPKYSKKVTLRNNQEISWGTYLNNSSRYLFLTKGGDKGNPYRKSDALRELKRVVGIELETITEKLSKKYLENPENTKYDLQQFANGIDSGKIEDLSTINPKPSTKVTLRNNQEISWEAYLNNASRYLFGTKKGDKDNPHRTGDALRELKRVVGIELETITEKLSKKYLENPENTEYDLQQFANGIDSGKIEDLSTVNPKPSTKVTLRNNQEISWEAYLRNASIYLFGTKEGDKGNPHRIGDALRKLKRVVGIEELSKKYLENPENTKYDLQQFANGIDSGKIEDLSTVNPKYSKKVTLRNNQEISWITYLNNASGYLFGKKGGDKGNPYRKSDALRELKRVVGVISEKDIEKEKRNKREKILNPETEEFSEIANVFRQTGSYHVLAGLISRKYGDIFDNEYQAQFSLRDILGKEKIGTVYHGDGVGTGKKTIERFQDIQTLLEEEEVFNHFKERIIDESFSSIEKDEEVGIDELLGKRSTFEKDSLSYELLSEVIEFYEDILTIPLPDCFENQVEANKDGKSNRSFPSLHQKMAMKRIGEEDRILLAEGVGTGKTASAILSRETKEMKEKYGRSPKTLVICPPDAKTDVWETRIKEYYKDGQAPDFGLSNGDIGALKDKEIGIISFYDLTKEKIAQLKTFGYEYVVFDEVHNIKNIDGTWNKNAIDLIDSFEEVLNEKDQKLSLMALSATPIKNHLTSDIHYTFRILGLLEEGKEGVMKVLKTNPSFIKDAYRRRILRHNREDILQDLPEKTELVIEQDFGPNEQRFFDLVGKQEQLHPMRILNYQQLISINPAYAFNLVKKEIGNFVEESESKGDEDTVTKNLLFQMEIEKMQEEIGPLTGDYFENTKVNILKYKINEKFEAGEENKFLIFSSNITEGITKEERLANQEEDEEIGSLHNKLKDEYENMGFSVIFIDGKVSKKEREQIFARERENPDGKTIIFATGATVGEGVDMTFSHTTYKLNPAWTKTEEEQIGGRTHRPGQKHNVEYIKIIVGKLDQGIYKYTEWKNRKIQLVLDGEAQDSTDLTLIDGKNKNKVLKEFVN